MQFGTLQNYVEEQISRWNLPDLQEQTDAQAEADCFTELPRNDSLNFVPNVAHVNWFTKESEIFLFHNLLSLLSIQRIMKPDKIYFRYNVQPTGKYWTEALRKVPKLILKHVNPPKILLGTKLASPSYETSHSDADRIKVMLECGGIFMDLDIIILKSLEPLRKYPTTIGRL